MSETTLRMTFRVGGELTDPDSMVLSNSTLQWGVRRLDTGGVVVANNTPMVKESTGVYTYTFTDPDSYLAYEWVAAAVVGLNVYRRSESAQGGSGDVTSLATALDARIVPQVEGCPLPLIHQIEREIFGLFCRESECWRQTLTMLTVADQAQYTLVVPDRTTLWRLDLPVLLNGCPVTVNVLEQNDRGITLYTTPTRAGDTIQVKVALSPTENRDEAPGWLLTRHGAGLVHGVLAELYAMPRKPWSSPELVGYHHEKFLGAVADGRMEVVTKRSEMAKLVIPSI
jgi:hypothetical protein